MVQDRNPATQDKDKAPDAMMKSLDTGFGFLRLVLFLLVVAYLLSGITTIKHDEVGLVLRFGRIAGSTPMEQVRKPGILFAFPKPIDEVVRVKVKKVLELEVDNFFKGTFAEVQKFDYEDESIFYSTIDPEKEGYCLTGDNNVVQTLIVVKYQVNDPIKFMYRHADPESEIRAAVMAAMVRSTGEMPVDDILTDGKKELLKNVTNRTQDKLDVIESGIDVLSIEFKELIPARHVLDDFKAVQNAFIEKETRIKEAQSYRAERIPAAQASADSSVRAAEAYSANVLANARGSADAFANLLEEYRAQPEVVRERLYREGIDNAMFWQQNITAVPVGKNGKINKYKVLIPGKK